MQIKFVYFLILFSTALNSILSFRASLVCEHCACNKFDNYNIVGMLHGQCNQLPLKTANDTDKTNQIWNNTE